MPSIASSATSVLIAHVAANTETIRLGSGGIMLPNHSPLVIAEQFGTLASLHPGRIDLGLGRAPGTDQVTMRALRRDPTAADTFPQDVLELQGYLTGPSRIPGIEATPGRGTDVPLYILGSSLFGAQLAAQLGLPYAFASHFAPDALEQAVAVYRDRFEPSAQLAEPYVIAGVNALDAAVRRRILQFVARGRTLSPEEQEVVLASPAAAQVAGMVRYRAVGTAEQVRDGLAAFAKHADADELILATQASSTQAWLRSFDLLVPEGSPASVG